ncbi:MAG: hypothetical protein U1B80_06785, partial [Anaerolineaceae bacterium]|nr:hypothetical protein [Anaerolineaceae bacterium]
YQNVKNKAIYAAGRIIGEVEGSTFKKAIHGSRHFLRQPPAIAISVDALDAAEHAGATQIEVLDKESGVRYRSSVQHFRDVGFTFERGFGRQIALPMAGWTMSSRGGQLSEQLQLWREGAGA